MLTVMQLVRMGRISGGEDQFEEIDRELEKIGLVEIDDKKTSIKKGSDWLHSWGGINLKYVQALDGVRQCDTRLHRCLAISMMVNANGNWLSTEQIERLAVIYACSTRTIRRDQAVVKQSEGVYKKLLKNWRQLDELSRASDEAS
jgi:hypothetical protein